MGQVASVSNSLPSFLNSALARAYAVAGDKDKSLAEYREFLALWKNADPDVRILREAKTEYTKLNNSVQ